MMDFTLFEDYRFSWIRDASFTVYALIRLGFTAEATAYMDFIQSRISTASKGRPLQIVFGIRGETDLTEVSESIYKLLGEAQFTSTAFHRSSCLISKGTKAKNP